MSDMASKYCYIVFVLGFILPTIYTLNDNLKHLGVLNSKFKYGYISMKRYSNHTVDVTPIRSFVASKYAECGVSCIQEKTPRKCLSINVEHLSPASQVNCSLLDTDKFRSHGKFIAKQNVDHYAVQHTCLTNPCTDGRLCIPHYENGSFDCITAESGSNNNGGPVDYRTIEFTRDTMVVPTITKTFPSPELFSYCMWLNPREINDNVTDLDAVFSLSYLGSRKLEVGLSLRHSSLRLYFQDQYIDASYDVLSTMLNKWTHFCAKYRSKYINILINGTMIQVLDLPESLFYWKYENSFEAPFALGQVLDKSGDVITKVRTFPGKISEFYFFLIKLSSSDIEKIYKTHDVSFINENDIFLQMSDFKDLLDNDTVRITPYAF